MINKYMFGAEAPLNDANVQLHFFFLLFLFICARERSNPNRENRKWFRVFASVSNDNNNT